jgi:hypothetical protein
VIEVFKTDVLEVKESNYIVRTLLSFFPHYKINFDLDDCDKILRVDAPVICIEKIIQLLQSFGYQCEILE